MEEAGSESLCWVERPAGGASELTRNSLRQKVTAIPSGACSCWKSSSPMLVSVTMALLALSTGRAQEELRVLSSGLTPAVPSWGRSNSLTCLLLMVAAQDDPLAMANAQCDLSQRRGKGQNSLCQNPVTRDTADVCEVLCPLLRTGEVWVRYVTA